MGDIFAIRSRLEELDTEDSPYTRFLREALYLAKELKLLEIQQFFKQYLDE